MKNKNGEAAAAFARCGLDVRPVRLEGRTPTGERVQWYHRRGVVRKTSTKTAAENRRDRIPA